MRSFKFLIIIALYLTYIGDLCAAGETGARLVGVCLSLSGEYSESGMKALAGVKLRIDDYNNTRGSDEKPIELVIQDDKSRAEVAAENVSVLAGKGVQGIVGPLSTGQMLAMREPAEKNGVVLVSPSATSPKIGKDGDWAFRVLFDDEFQGVALARFLAGKKDIKKVAVVINDKFAYAESMFKAFAAEFNRLDGKIVAEEHYSFVAKDDSDFDFEPILQKVADAGPDYVLLPLHSAEVADVVRTSTQMGLGLHFCGGDTWQHENVLLSGGNDLENAYFISGINFDSGTPEMRHFRYLYDHSNDPDAQLTSVLGYDAATVLLEGMKNGEKGEEIKEGLYGIRNLQLASGTMTVHPGHGSEKSAYIHRINMGDTRFESAIIDEIKP